MKEAGEGYISGMVPSLRMPCMMVTGVRVKTLLILPEKIVVGLKEGKK